MAHEPVMRQIVAYVYRRGAATIDEIQRDLGIQNRRLLIIFLYRLTKKGKLRRIARGVYAPAEPAPTAVGTEEEPKGEEGEDARAEAD